MDLSIVLCFVAASLHLWNLVESLICLKKGEALFKNSSLLCLKKSRIEIKFVRLVVGLAVSFCFMLGLPILAFEILEGLRVPTSTDRMMLVGHVGIGMVLVATSWLAHKDIVSGRIKQEL